MRLALEVAAQSVDVGPGDQAEEEVLAALLPGPAAHLLGDGRELALGCDVAVGRGLAEGRAVAVQRGRDGREPGADVGPRLLALGRHQVEDRADLVQPAGDHRHLGLRHAGLVQLDLEAEPLEEGVLGDLLPLVDGGRGGGVRERASGQVRARGVPVGGEVGEHVVVAGETEVRRGDRVEGGVVVDETLCDGVDRAGGGLVVGRHSRTLDPTGPRGRGHFPGDQARAAATALSPSSPKAQAVKPASAPDSATCSGARIASITLSSIPCATKAVARSAVQPVRMMTS